MGSYEALKTAITNAIKQNGNAEITGDLLQQVLLAIVSNIGKGATFAGFAVPTTNPGTSDNNVFYLAAKNGTYVNFGGLVLENQLAAITNKSGEWIAEVVDLVTADALDTLQTTLQGEIDAEQARAIARENAIEAMFSGDVEEAVNAWLEAHPEATTTVLDNSITFAKLNEQVRQRVGYAKNVLEYPGETFQQKLEAALADETSETRVFFIPPGVYEITETIIYSGQPFKLMGQSTADVDQGTVIKCKACGFINMARQTLTEICNMYIYGENSNQEYCITDANGISTYIHDVGISGFMIGILEYGMLCVFERNILEACNIGIAISSSVNCIVRDAIMALCHEAILLDTSTSLVITRCIIEFTIDAHFEIHSCNDVLITECYTDTDSSEWMICGESKNIKINNTTSLITGKNYIFSLSNSEVEVCGELFMQSPMYLWGESKLDLTNAKLRRATKQIDLSSTPSRWLITARPAQYMVGYTLCQIVEDATCPATFYGMIEDTGELNFAGNKVLALNSYPATGSIDVDRYSPGIKYHFKVPKGFIGRNIWLNMGIRATDTTQEIKAALVGVHTKPMYTGDATYSTIGMGNNYERLKLLNNYDCQNILLNVLSEDIYITIYHEPLNIPRSIKFKIDYIYISEDNRFALPPDWKPENRTSGVTTLRPIEAKDPGFVYYDTTINKPIYWNGTEWKDAMGNNV